VLGAQQVADCLRREIAGLRLSGNAAASVSASLGVAVALPGELDVEAVIARADEALYRAKRSGRNRFCLATTRSVLEGQAANIGRLKDLATA
jgi:diguanylate cyclase (GGDEF)-like protein